MNSKRGKEDYLRVILELERENNIVRSIDISKKLKISKPSVSEMLKKLAKFKLIDFKPYSKVQLTNKGEKLARIVREKHEIIEKFAEKFQHSKPHDEAHNLEHHFSDEMLARISEFIEGKRKIENPPGYIS